MKSHSLTEFLDLWAKADESKRAAAIAELSGEKSDELLDLNEARKKLSVSRATLWRMMKKGAIRYVEPVPGLRRIPRIEIIKKVAASAMADRLVS